MRRLIAAVLFCIYTAGAPLAANAADMALADPAVGKRVEELSQNLRCLVCQNQTIADSQAPLAIDLKNQIREKIDQGQSNEQIIDYMVQRYGDFVLYRPPVRAATLLLWFGPAALLILGIFVLFRYLAGRRKERPTDVPLTDAERKRAHALLGMSDKESP
jgi:cytochrome c-type biogenesis protein CcmH